MPTYQYECTKCGATFDVFQSMKDSALAICPEEKCTQKRWGRGKIRRQVGSGAGVIFKGSGFYTTDYRSDSYKSAAKKETEGTAKPAAADAKKSEASPPASAPKTPAPSKTSKGSEG